MSDFTAAPITFLPVDSITIPPDRQRTDARADESLLNSIREHGLFNPIIIHADAEHTLVAGERRLDAFKQLQRPTIPCRIFEQLTVLEASLVELQENLDREQLSWQDETRAIAHYHAQRLSDFPGWTQLGTASDISRSVGFVSQRLTLAAALHDPDIAGASTFTGAFNLLSARADRAIAAASARGLMSADALASVIPQHDPNMTKDERTDAILAGLSDDFDQAVTTTNNLLDKFQTAELARAALDAAAVIEREVSADDRVLHTSFVDWASTYTGPKFDVLHCDFPYGKNYSGSNTRRTGRATTAPTYADGSDIYFTLVDTLLAQQDSFMLSSAHCIFWFDMMHYCWTVEQFTSAGWRLTQPFPLIWTKNYQGVASDPQRRPRHCYETALLFSRGDRRIRHLDQDYFEGRVDEKLHMSQKPIDMLRHFLALVVDEHTAVLDPTCGSGSALAASNLLGASRVLGLEIDESNVDIARFLLKRETSAQLGTQPKEPS